MKEISSQDKVQFLKKIILLAAIFCGLVTLLLLLNYFQFTRNETLESKTLEALVERLREEPNNEELKEEIRYLDLLVRKAYFTSRWQVKTGAYLLLFGAVVCAIALRFFYSLKAKIEEPETVQNHEIADRILSQRWILLTGAAGLVLALGVSLATVNHLDSYTLSETNILPEEQPAEEGIEVVEVRAASDGAEDVPARDSGKRVSEEDADEEGKPEPVSGGKEPSEKEADGEQPDPGIPDSKAVAATLTTTQVNENYNSFRGPWSQGVTTVSNAPLEWNGANGTNLIWKTPIPKPGFNSPVVWEDRVFLSGGDEKAREVYCFNRNTGELIWSGAADNIPGSPDEMPGVTDDTGLAAPTVTTDGQYVFAIFATGDIVCFDMSGTRIWARNLGVPDNHYGHSSSLVTWNGKVFVQMDTNSGAKAMALNSTNGETIWETKREAGISWASPVLADINGKKQVVLTGTPLVAGYDTESGEELWAVECMMGEVGPSVAVCEEWIFAANEYARLAAIDPVKATIVWEDDFYLPEVASPVCAKGLLIVATTYGMLVCYDAKTGELLWEEDFGTVFYASPVIADNKIYALDTEGVMHILELSREPKVLGQPELGEEGYASPAFSEGRIYIRGISTLYCFGT
jgi:outer membrane protein assembly factor BamB